ncbi:MAG: hypothetical protein ACLPWF_19660 [Bryobacteraceae bacterium]
MKILLLLALSALGSYARVDPLDSIWQGYDGVWRPVSNQLVGLAEAVPAEKYAWRPAGPLVAYARVNGIVPPWS